jgi:hypothetical protein
LHSTKPENPQLAEYHFIAEAAGATRWHLVAPPQKMPYAFLDVVVNRPIGRGPSAIAEVRRPAS